MAIIVIGQVLILIHCSFSVRTTPRWKSICGRITGMHTNMNYFLFGETLFPGTNGVPCSRVSYFNQSACRRNIAFSVAKTHGWMSPDVWK